MAVGSRLVDTLLSAMHLQNRLWSGSQPLRASKHNEPLSRPGQRRTSDIFQMTTSRDFRVEPLLLVVTSCIFDRKGMLFFCHLVIELEMHATTVFLASIVAGKLVKMAKKTNRWRNTKKSFAKMRKDTKDQNGI